tara:strand:+ start:590 stop:823 length:234 start_codon:yes stop_codon:yes gene_type:complete
MIKSKSEKPNSGKIEIDLTGPDGNAYVLMAYARKLSEALGYSKDKAEEVVEHMTEGDYEHFLNVFEKHYGEFVILYR